ncbi:hypothetical protein, partial [Mesorhizobium carmichaelinearum]|uniref:hypothetical protein n=1 Tax=Mesorhizobium carmichaelinearum TaxID=1208188 RepID=UPI001AECDF7D
MAANIHFRSAREQDPAAQTRRTIRHNDTFRCLLTCNSVDESAIDQAYVSGLKLEIAERTCFKNKPPKGITCGLHTQRFSVGDGWLGSNCGCSLVPLLRHGDRNNTRRV